LQPISIISTLNGVLHNASKNATFIPSETNIYEHPEGYSAK